MTCQGSKAWGSFWTLAFLLGATACAPTGTVGGSPGTGGGTGGGGDTGAAGTTGTGGGAAGTTAAGTGGGTAGTTAAGTGGGTAGTSAAGGGGGAAGTSAAGGGGAAGTTAAGGRGGAGGTAAGGRGGAGGTAAGGRGGAGGTAAGGRGGGAGTSAAGTSGGTAGATGGATFNVQVQLASAVNANAPGTIGIVTWTVGVSSLVEAHIDFGLDTSYGMTAPVDLALADHRTLLLGMKPARTYHFRVVARDATASYMSGDYTVMTGPAPAASVVSIAGFQVMNAAARKRGFIITSYWMGTGMAVPFIIDGDGDIVWWFRNGPSGIARAAMSADGKNMWMISANNNGAALQRVTMDTLSPQTYTGVIGSHDITPVSGETMAFLDYGESDCESIFEITPSGTTREVWESQGVVQASGCHGNALRYSQKEDFYTFSEVRQDVFVISRAGMLQWRLSQRVSGGNTAWGGVQHGHQLLDNSILIYANSGGGTNMSAAIEYSLTGQELMRFSSGDYSANLGYVQRLPGGNTLVTFSNDSVIKEIDAQKNVVLQIDGSGSRLGYALWRESLYGPPPDIAQ